MGLPASATTTARSSSLCFSSAACSCSRQRRRKAWSVDHVVSSKARRAAAMAVSMSRGVASAVSPSDFSVAGSMLAKLPPAPASVSFPSISSRGSPRTSAGVASLIALPPSRPGPLLAQPGLQHFAIGLPGKLVDELDAPGKLEIGEMASQARPQALLVPRRAGAELHDGVHLLAHALVGEAEHGGVDHVGLLEERRLDLGRVDVHA